MYTPAILKINALRETLAFSVDFSNRQGTSKDLNNRTTCEIGRVNQQAFIFTIAGVHSSLEERVKKKS